MTTFIGILHVIVALILIVLVLIQDSKSNGALGMGGSSGGSNSLLGATGAQTLASKMTVWSAIIFAVTCLTLSVLTSSHTKSVLDTVPAAATTAPAAPMDATPAAAAPTAPAETTAPAAPAQQ